MATYGIPMTPSIQTAVAAGSKSGGGFGLNQVGALVGRTLEGYGEYQEHKGLALRHVAGARSAKFAAKETKKRTWRAEDLHRRAAKQYLATIAQTYADAGVTPKGAPTVALAASAKELELEALMIRREGQVTAKQYLQSAQDYEAMAEAAKKAGKMNLLGGIMSTAISLIPKPGK